MLDDNECMPNKYNSPQKSPGKDSLMNDNQQNQKESQILKSQILYRLG